MWVRYIYDLEIVEIVTIMLLWYIGFCENQSGIDTFIFQNHMYTTKLEHFKFMIVRIKISQKFYGIKLKL